MENAITQQSFPQSRLWQNRIPQTRSNDPATAFCLHIHNLLGFSPSAHQLVPGKIVRFATSDKRSDRSGWASFFEDAQGGAFGCWRTGISDSWQPQLLQTQEERRAWFEVLQRNRARADQELANIRANCRKKAESIWQRGQEIESSHPYLLAKRIQPYGAKQRGRLLLIPLRGCDEELRGLQIIAADGSKKFLAGTEVGGGYLRIGTPASATLLICEGWATGCSLHEATGHAVVVSFNAGNLLSVGTMLRKRYPDWTIVVCADDDFGTEGNPGLSKAMELAKAVNGSVVTPDFSGFMRGPRDTDFNDLAAIAGISTVKSQIKAAIPQPNPTPFLPSCREEHLSVRSCGPEPAPLPAGLLPVAKFNFDLLPLPLRRWGQDICERVQCPPDFVAVGIMSALGTVLGRKVGIRPQAHTDWTEIPNQWALVVGRPGVLKSPALEAALSPLKRLATLANTEYAANLKEYRHAEQVAKLRAEQAEKLARKQLASNPDADVMGLLTTEEPDTPTIKRYMANDTSAAALGELMRQNPNGLLVFRDELVSLLRTLSREDQAEARGFYLTGWNGNSPYTFDRIGRGMNLHIPAICLSLLGGTQPGRLAEYVRQAVKGGTEDDGLIQRFGLLVWPDTDSEWRNIDRWPDNVAKREAFAVFDRLDKLEPDAINAQQDIDHQGQPEGIPYLRFEPAALNLFLEWRIDFENRKMRGGELTPALESHFSKYRKLIPGLALILHLADGNVGPISEKNTLQALAWSEYLESHARRVYCSAPQATTETAKAILHRIRKGDLQTSFSSRDVWRPGWSKLTDRADVAEALQLLVDYDWLFEERSTNTGGRPSTTYHVNPCVRPSSAI